MTRDLDLLVIGSGPGGYRAAVLGALRGLEVAIVERADWGGCCLNRGCVPKKAWHHSARILTDQQGFAGRGIRGELRGDLQQAWTHQHRMVARVKDSYLDYMKRLGIQSLQGTARFLTPDRVRVTAGVTAGDADTREVAARHVVIATGSRPAAPPGVGTIPGRVLDSDMLFDQGVPAGDRVVLIGSGVVATEFAFILSALGKRVTWLARSRMLRRARFSAQALAALQGALEDAGIRLRTEAFPLTIRTPGDSVTVHPNDGDGIDADWVCLATGRRPNTEHLDLDAAGIAVDPRGFVVRDPYLRTSQPHVYAIGDCASADMTANHALADATVAVENIVNGDHRRQAPERIPLVVYSALELARIGLDEESAEDAGHEPAVGFAAFESNPCALGQDQRRGFVRLLADLDSGALLGGEIVGDGAGELVHLLSLAPDRETALRRLADGVYNHPTRAEELINATETLAFRWGMGEHVFG